jgi:hypothetical protein
MARCLVEAECAENVGRGQAHVLMTLARPAKAAAEAYWGRLASSTEKEESKP